MPRRLLAGLAGVALAAVAVTSAFAAYGGGTPITVDVTSPATAVSGTPFTVSALVMGQPPVSTAQNGDVALEGITVDWTFSAPSGVSVKINPTSSITNASGVASTTATIVCDNCSVTFLATAESANGTAVVKVKEAGLPNTATSTSGMSGSFIATLLAALAIIAGAILMARQVVVSRR